MVYDDKESNVWISIAVFFYLTSEYKNFIETNAGSTRLMPKENVVLLPLMQLVKTPIYNFRGREKNV